MAIQNFAYYVKQFVQKQRAKAITYPQLTELSGKMDHVYIDVNNVLYPMSRHKNSGTHLYRSLHHKLHLMIKDVGPKHSVFMSLDGPATRAKLHLQRERRAKEIITPEDSHNLSQVQMFTKMIRSERHAKEDNLVIHPSQLTSGTLLMNYISSGLNYSCHSYLNHTNSQLDYFISGSNRPGEGELKIFQHISDHHASSNSATHLVIGDDSDIIVYGLLQKRKAIFVYRNGSLIDVSEVRAALCQSFADLGLSEQEEDRIIDDVSFLSILCGTDFVSRLPYFAYYAGLERYMTYKKENRNEFLIDMPDNSNFLTVNMKALRAILQHMHPQRVFSPSKTSQFVNFVTRFLRTGMEFTLMPHALGYQMSVTLLSNQHLFSCLEEFTGVGSDKDSAKLNLVKQIVESDALLRCVRKVMPDFSDESFKELLTLLDEEPLYSTQDTSIAPYFETVAFNMEYFRGNCSDTSHFQKHLPPSIANLISYPHDKLVVKVPRSRDRYLYPLEFCLAVTPYSLAKNIPDAAARELMKRDSPVADLYHGTPDELNERWSSDDAVERIVTALQQKLKGANVRGMKFEPAHKFSSLERNPSKKPDNPQNIRKFIVPSIDLSNVKVVTSKESKPIRGSHFV